MTTKDPRWLGREKVLSVEKSFVSHPSFSFFSQELNPDIDPRYITKRSGKNLNMKCPKCLHIYSCSPHILKGCRFCTNQELCENIDCIICFEKSLASRHFKGIEEYNKFVQLIIDSAKEETIYSILLKTCALYDYKKNMKSCRYIFKSSSTIECWFICHNCDHSFKNPPCHVEDLQNCPYCSPNNAKILCPKDNNCEKCFVKSFASHPRAICWDYSDGKNKGLTPYNVFKSGTHRADMICGDCNMLFPMSCNNISTGYWCPFCKNKTEAKMKLFLNTLPQLDFKYQYKPDWLYNTDTKGQRSFDFADVKNNKCCEVDGDHHFYDKKHWDSTGEENLERDIQKMLLSVKHKFSGFRIYQPDVLFDKCDWQKWVIDAINCINTESEPVWIFPKNPQYEGHIEECIARGINYIVL